MRNSNPLMSALLLWALLTLPATAQALEADAPASTSPRMHSVAPATQDAIYPHRHITEHSLDDYGEDVGRPVIADPLEPWNRFWFSFNDKFFLYVARPLYHGYDAVMPREFQSGLKNFLSNILFPIRFVNCLLQGKVNAAGVEFARFMVNTTVGFGGFIDAAKGRKTVVDVDPSGEDLGQTLGTWGVGHGFYIVWPIIGPSSLRESVGLGGDMFLSPLYYLQPVDLAVGVSASLRFNTLSDILPMYEDINKAAVDPYVAAREAYITFREEHVKQ